MFTADLWELHPWQFRILHSGWLSRRVTTDFRSGQAVEWGRLVWICVACSRVLQWDKLRQPHSATRKASTRPDGVQLRLPDGVQDDSSRRSYRQIWGRDPRSVSILSWLWQHKVKMNNALGPSSRWSLKMEVVCFSETLAALLKCKYSKTDYQNMQSSGLKPQIPYLSHVFVCFKKLYYI
jgi:hypothetical protein